jgi:glucosyl-3-phosphoglycerate synthase
LTKQQERLARWFDLATSAWQDWDVAALLAAKGGHQVSVVVPARNEVETVGHIVARIRADLVEAVALVDEVVVIDSDSSDATARVATDAGAAVHAAREIRPELGTYAGKGEALWKSLFVTSGDILVFVDGDLTGWDTNFVTGLLGPLLFSDRINLVKGYYDREFDDCSGAHGPQGGRVTELVARPILNLHWPDLSHVVQPLAGEWAIRRSAFESLHVPVGYGVEIAALLDVYARGGLAAIAQVDLGARAHTHQSVHDLGVMAAEIMAVAARRMGLRATAPSALWQFHRGNEHPWQARVVPTAERPPAFSIGAPPC